jgi:Transposase DDE domain
LDILRLFFDCDEFCRLFEPPARALRLSDGKRHRHRESTLSTSEVMTIVILFQLSGFRNLKTYSTHRVCKHLRGEFPDLVSYGRFVELQSEIVLPLAAFLRARFGQCTGVSFIDSTPIKVCHNLRSFRWRV